MQFSDICKVCALLLLWICLKSDISFCFGLVQAIRMQNLQLCQHEQFILASLHPPLPRRRVDSRSSGSDPEGGYGFCEYVAQDLVQGRWLSYF
jgi:hypothetical protein